MKTYVKRYNQRHKWGYKEREYKSKFMLAESASVLYLRSTFPLYLCL